MFTKSNFRLHGLIAPRIREAALRELAGTAAWGDNTVRQSYPGTAHSDTKTIVLRGPANWPTAQHDLSAVDGGYALPAVQRCVTCALALLPFKEVGRVFVVSLRAGGHIARHRDEGAYAEHYSRMHLVLQSEVGNTFDCGSESKRLRPGEVWSFNHREEHEVWNKSASPRIHIIIDYKE